MDLSYLKTHWKNGMDQDIAASVQAWDSVAEDYRVRGRIRMEENPFLRYVRDKVPLSKKMRVLDVGCGAGAYTMALADAVDEAVGVDFSPKMLAAAESEVAARSISNVKFLLRDWYGCDGAEFRGQYDLVFAHTTPAIADYETLVKMMGASRRYCILCKPARRTDQVFDTLRKIAGLGDAGHDDSVAYAFDTIWGHGYNPEVTYQTTVWQSEKPLADAETWFLGRLKGSCDLSPEKERQIRSYLTEISRDGKVAEVTHTTLVTMFWEVGP